MVKSFKTIKIDEETYEQLKLISKRLNKPSSRVLGEIMEKLHEIAIEFDEGCNLSFESRVSTGILVIQTLGRNKLLTGAFLCPTQATDSTIEQRINKEVEAKFKETENVRTNKRTRE